MLRVGQLVDAECRCECCPDPGSGGLNTDIDGVDLIHRWDAEALPHPYTLEEETFGGASINSSSLSLVNRNVGGIHRWAGRITLDITAPSGRWNAWVILWMPSSSVPITEVIDVNDPNGIANLLYVRNSAVVRLGSMNKPITSGPYPVWGLVVEYDGTRYYTPHAYIPDKVPDEFDPQTLVDNRPFCWKVMPNQNDGETINPSTLDYSGSPVVWPCNPDPSAITRVGHVIGLTTVGENPSDDREAAGTITAGIDFDNPIAAAYYADDCDCWWVPAIPTLTATFETAPAEIVGETLTLTRQGDGTFTGSGTYGPDSLPYTLTYNPCGYLVLELDDCDESENPNWPTLTLTFTATPSGTWQPVDLLFVNQACYPVTGIGGALGWPACGLTANSSCTTGSPPFVQIDPGFLFGIRLEE